MGLIDGDNAISGDRFSFQQHNRLKNHWRQSDPIANLSNPQNGMIVSDADDDSLYHKISGAGGYSGFSGYAEVAQPGITILEKARAFLSANQLNLMASSVIQVQLDSESYDPFSDFDTAAYEYTVAVDGYYQISAQVTFTGTVADRLYCGIVYADYGTSAVQTLMEMAVLASSGTGLDYVSCLMSDIHWLTVGQVIGLYCYNESGVNTVDVLGGTQWTYLTISRVF